MDRSLFPYKLTSSTVSALNIVKVNLGYSAGLEFQQDRRTVLGIDIQGAVLARKTRDSGHFSKNPRDVIQFMNRIENHTATKTSIRTVAFSVVFPRMPVRQIVSELNAR